MSAWRPDGREEADLAQEVDDRAQRQFLAEYEAYVRDILKPTQAFLKEIFREWRRPDSWLSEAQSSGRLAAPTPIQRAVTRVKRPESVVDKILRKPESFPDGLQRESILAMPDAVAGRIVTYFLSGLPMIDKRLRSDPRLRIVDDDPPIAYLNAELLSTLGLGHIEASAKASGYASIHYVVEVLAPGVRAEVLPRAEIQVRTLVEDTWGEIEHVLGYKPNKRTSFAVRRQFELISKQLTAIDEHFNFLYDELLRFQQEVEIEDTDPLNAENLPQVLNEIGTGCAQREIDGLLKLLVSRGVSTVEELRGVGAGAVVDIVRHTYRNHVQREPVNFEVVACLAAIGKRDHEPNEDIEAVVRSQIDYLEGWVALREEFG